MSRKVYFGNDQKQVWINAPQTAMVASSAGYVFEQQLLSGFTFVKRSDASHRRFEMAWLGSLNAPELEDSLQVIKEFSDGIHGNSKLFWNDPYATTTNLFSPAWATPFMSIGTDWDAICPDDAGITKEVVTTASISALVGNNTQGYPANSAKFIAPDSPTLESDKFTFYVPSGYTLWIGLHGHHGETGAVYGKAYKNNVAATPTAITALGVDSTSRVNASFSSTVADKVEFYIAKIASGSCTFHISGIIAQILPTGVTPATGKFLSGRGTTGLQFATFPQIEYYSANLNNGQVGMSLSFVEK
jgi:hypothetical protein